MLRMVRIYHNPHCSKSRATLALIREQGIEPEIIDYLSDPPDPAALAELLRCLGLGARQLLRTGEREYQALGLDRESLDEQELIRAMSRYPVLMQRPIVVSDKGARLGRPPESVLEVL